MEFLKLSHCKQQFKKKSAFTENNLTIARMVKFYHEIVAEGLKLLAFVVLP
jgi:hypothetical protein